MKTPLVLLIVSVIVLSIFGTIAALRISFGSVTSEPYYQERESQITNYDIFDVGVVDIDSDQQLDVFTVNHSARQSLLLNDGSGTFQDVLTTFRLDQDSHFPALEDSSEEVEIAKPGLYIYRYNRWLYLRAHEIDETAPVKGVLDIPWGIVIRDAPATVDVDQRIGSEGALMSTVDFSLHGSQMAVLNGIEDIAEIPHSISLGDNVDLSMVYVGRNLVTPPAHRFELVWRDRHGMAWADFDGDRDIDVFMSRGGIRGQLDQFPFVVSDELMSGVGNVFTDVAATSGLHKGNCPSRQVAWVDFDSDGDLDLYVCCGRFFDPIFPNQLFRQDPNHQFVDVAEEKGLDFASASVFSWLDSDSDNDMDLLSVEDGMLYHYINDGGEFDKQAIDADVPGSSHYKIAVADYDNDGDLDAFAVHGSQSYVVQNSEGSFSLRKPSLLGLPDRGRTANWVDFDNDGLIDLHVVPDGLYRHEPDHTFRKIDVLLHKGQRPEYVDAIGNWFDANNDGYRDLILATQSGPTIWQRLLRKFAGRTPDLRHHWRSTLLQYSGPKDNHWLQIQLSGPASNQQAIGARAYVSTPEATQMQQVGSADGSHFSQGHYRLYFGLANYSIVDQVRVVWPNGETEILNDVPADQLLHVRYSADTP